MHCAPAPDPRHFLWPAPMVAIFRPGVPPSLGGRFPLLLAPDLSAVPLPLMIMCVRQEPLLATATFLPTTPFFHRAQSPAPIPPGPASNPKPSGYGMNAPFLWRWRPQSKQSESATGQNPHLPATRLQPGTVESKNSGLITQGGVALPLAACMQKIFLSTGHSLILNVSSPV
jgi:hypothetical protein